MFEYSDKLQTVETYKPAYDASGKFIGLDHEAVFYDPEAFVQPLHATYRFVRQATPSDPDRRYTYIECLSNLRNTNGRPTQLTARRSSIYRLLRPAVGPELGEIFRGRLGQAPGRSSPGNTGHSEVKKLFERPRTRTLQEFDSLQSEGERDR